MLIVGQRLGPKISVSSVVAREYLAARVTQERRNIFCQGCTRVRDGEDVEPSTPQPPLRTTVSTEAQPQFVVSHTGTRQNLPSFRVLPSHEYVLVSSESQCEFEGGGGT